MRPSPTQAVAVLTFSRRSLVNVKNAYALPPFVLMGPLLKFLPLCPAPSLLLLQIFDLVGVGGQFLETRRPTILKLVPRARQTFSFSKTLTSIAPLFHALCNGIFGSSVYKLIAPSHLLPQPLPVVPHLWCPSVQCP